MREGLVTRVGRWLDANFEPKALESDLINRFNTLENAAVQDKIFLQDLTIKVKSEIYEEIEDLKTAHARLKQVHSNLVCFTEALEKRLAAIPPESVTQAISKDLDDLKTRMERLELYSGMTRKVDPTKAAVVKSAFSM